MDYSSYRIKKAKNIKFRWDFESKCFIVNEKYEVRRLRKGDWICTCRWYSDNKHKNYGYCSHILGIFYHLNKQKYMEETKTKNE